MASPAHSEFTDTDTGAVRAGLTLKEAGDQPGFLVLCPTDEQLEDPEWVAPSLPIGVPLISIDPSSPAPYTGTPSIPYTPGNALTDDTTLISFPEPPSSPHEEPSFPQSPLPPAPLARKPRRRTERMGHPMTLRKRPYHIKTRSKTQKK